MDMHYIEHQFDIVHFSTALSWHFTYVGSVERGERNISLEMWTR